MTESELKTSIDNLLAKHNEEWQGDEIDEARELLTWAWKHIRANGMERMYGGGRYD